jgi:YHS domain-containing protein
MSVLKAIFMSFAFAMLVGCLGCTPYQPDRDHLKDPVCGRRVQPDRAIVRCYDGWEYYFDSEDCARKFDLHPARYVDMVHYVLEHQDG